MKRFMFIFTLTLLFSFNVCAETYHGIDIDKVYSQSDWSSEDKIKEIIDDYKLLVIYQKELDDCSTQNGEIFFCYDNIAEKILKNLYVYPENNIKVYQQFKQTLTDAYSVQSCLNKYDWPSGNLCEVNSQPEILKVLHSYIQSLINSSKEKMLSYLPELKNYK